MKTVWYTLFQYSRSLKCFIDYLFSSVRMAELVFDGMSEPVVLSPVGLGRKRGRTKFTRESAKRIRHSGDGKESVVSCTHNDGFCKALALSAVDLAVNHSRYVLFSIRIKSLTS